MNRKIDRMGRISIPKEMRDKINLGIGSEAHVMLKGNKIIISNPDKFDLEEYLKEKISSSERDSLPDAANAYYDILSKIKEPN